jgi:nicotinamide phosphoribosyltransferase
MTNPLFAVDSYKLSHYKQYPPGSQVVSSYIEARGGDFHESVFFGLQAYLKEFLSIPITKEMVDEAVNFYAAHGTPFNEAGFRRIVNKHGGYWPIAISAVEEGSVMPLRNVQVQAHNTDEELPWVTSLLETSMLRAVWYPSTVATISREAKKAIYTGLQITSENPDAEIPFKLHDFGGRGVSSAESAGLGGMAHLVNFMGTDTVEGLVAAMKYYGGDMPGFSIPATEHSTMTAWGRENEVAAYRNLLEQHPTGLVACVSDSYDIYNATSNIWGRELKEMVEARDGTLVVRPDSGNPTVVPLKVIEMLMDRFGFTTNSKGYKVLPPCVRVIQGDGMNLDTIKKLVVNAMDRGISVDNFAMGMGGGLLQKLDRDTLQYAMKASAIKINNVWQDVYKEPATDTGKKSKRGRLMAVRDTTGVHTVTMADDGTFGEAIYREALMSPVWRDGELLRATPFAQVRENAALS